MARRRRLKGEAGELAALQYRPLRELQGTWEPTTEPAVHKAGTDNNSFVFGNRLILKLFRRVEPGIHPETEMDRFLADRSSFANVAPIAGQLEYVPPGADSTVLGVLHAYVPHEADAWHYTMDSLSRYFERARTFRKAPDDTLFGAAGRPLFDLSQMDPPREVSELVGEYLERSRLLGQRTAELHLALAGDSFAASRPEPAEPRPSGSGALHSNSSPRVTSPPAASLAGDSIDADFRPEPLSEFDKQGMYHGILALTTRVFQTLRVIREELPTLEEGIRERLRWFRDSKTSGSRIRVHGNYKLSKALYTGKDFVIVDFEGDPSLHLTERRMKRPPFYDVAGMLVSFHDAIHSGRLGQMPGAGGTPDKPAGADRHAELWYRWVAAAFLKGYVAAEGATRLLPDTGHERETLLNVLTLERFILQAERRFGRPEVLMAPLAGIERVVKNWTPAPVLKGLPGDSRK
jgi:maltose alpha-D-glucosyltransferase/alpha-amylase